MTVASKDHTTVLMDYLHQAHRAEQGVAGLLTRQVAGLPDGEHRDWLHGQVGKARRRVHDVEVRLGLLGETRGQLSATVEAVRRLAGDALDVSTTAVVAGLDVVRRQPVEPTLIDHARALAATAADARTVYRGVDEVAHAADDPQTGHLAKACHDELGELLTELDNAVPALVDAALDAADTRPTYREAAETATRRVREVAALAGEDADHIGQELRGTMERLLRRARLGASDEDAAEITALPEWSDMPIADYDQLTAAQVIDRLTDLPADQLLVVQRYEQAHAARITVLNKIGSLRGQDPAPDTTP
jgi:hypothetical protein